MFIDLLPVAAFAHNGRLISAETISGASSPIKRQILTDRVEKWIHTSAASNKAKQSHKQKYLNIKGRHLLRVKGWKKIFQANKTKKQIHVAFNIQQNGL